MSLFLANSTKKIIYNCPIKHHEFLCGNKKKNPKFGWVVGELSVLMACCNDKRVQMNAKNYLGTMSREVQQVLKV